MPKNTRYPRNSDRSAAELEALLSAAVDAIVLIDQDASIVEFNAGAEKLFGYAVDEVRGHSVEVLMPEPYRSSHAGYMQRYLAGGEPNIIGKGREVEGRKSSGEIFPIWLSVGEALYDDSRHFVGIIRDLTEMRTAEQQRHELEANLAHVGRFSLMGEMAAGIAHEINQPLSAIATYSQAAKRMMSAGKIEHADLEKACNGISDQVHRAGQVIENLRRFIKKQEVRKQRVDLNDVIRSAMSLIVSDTNAAGIKVATEYAEDLPSIVANAVQLQQVLINLTRNAVDAMRESLRKKEGIVIGTGRLDDERVFFSVTDRGSGVSARIADAIFHPFVTTKREGLGVGLAISQTIIRSHGGELSYRPNPSGGAIFTVSLPIEEEQASEQ